MRETTGLVGDVKSVVSTALRAVRTRLELFAIEVGEEKAWVMRLAAIGVGAFYLLTFGLQLAILALVVLAAEEYRALILGGFALAFLAAGSAAIAYFVSVSKRRAEPFRETIAVLKGDEAAFTQALRGTGD